jgi:aerobic carbon-monoxide dehydrogenase medium subunit
VKAGAFDYIRATSLPQALALLAEHGDDAKVLAGGQSLLPALNLRLSTPALLVDIGRLDELRGIALQDGVLRLGALTRHAELLTAPLVQAQAPLLARAIVHVAHPAIRSRGTLGGSLANADPAAELPACVLALQARLVLRSVRGERIVPAAAFFTGLFETALAADEILTAVEIDGAAAGSVCGFQELSRRSGDYAIVGLAAQGQMQGGTLQAIRLGYFSVGTRATLASAAAAALVRRPLDATVIEAAAEALATDLTPHDDLQASAATRLHLARVLLRRVVGEMADAA